MILDANLRLLHTVQVLEHLRVVHVKLALQLLVYMEYELATDFLDILWLVDELELARVPNLNQCFSALGAKYFKRGFEDALKVVFVRGLRVGVDCLDNLELEAVRFDHFYLFKY